jgi:hypothetical protein
MLTGQIYLVTVITVLVANFRGRLRLGDPISPTPVALGDQDRRFRRCEPTAAATSWQQDTETQDRPKEQPC